MTEIKYSEHDDRVRISVHGHAMYNPGNDVVCAGISTITFQLLNYLSVIEENGCVTDVVYDMADGHVIVTFRVPPHERVGWDTAWKVISIGYENLAESYPENVKISRCPENE